MELSEAMAAAGADPAVPVKKSVGVIVCRHNAASGRPEALLIRKRYTYAFAEFVHGRYARGYGSWGRRTVSALLDEMTKEELLDVLSLNFGQMWYRVWLTHENRIHYNKKYARFQTTFMRDDGGEGLRRLVMAARGAGSLQWEAPKGRRLNEREADIACAIREMREETGIEKNDYRFIPGAQRRVNYVSCGTRYICVYYVAIANPHLAGQPHFDGADPSRPAMRPDIGAMAEVGEVRWHDIERVRYSDMPNAQLESLLAPVFRLVKQYRRGYWPHTPAATADAAATAAATAAAATADAIAGDVGVATDTATATATATEAAAAPELPPGARRVEPRRAAVWPRRAGRRGRARM
jgi:8-oxo-dGTP pyrophosphatase MutT (NUDIX family)